MIDEKVVTIDGKEFIISKLPATVGREIVAKYAAGGKNILFGGDYEVSEKVMLKLMSYVAVNVEGRLIEVKTEELINNHIKSAMTLIKLEKEMMSYNFDFFTPDTISDFLTRLTKLADKESMRILTDLLGKLLPMVKQH